jgi:short-subunit dehydrogenase
LVLAAASAMPWRFIYKQGAQLILSARRETLLMELNQTLGNRHLVWPMDITQGQDRQQALEKMMTLPQPIDRVLLFPATYKPATMRQMDDETLQRIVDVNFTAIVQWVTLTMPSLIKIHHLPQLAICASVAGYRGLPQGQPYSATKAALINYTESLYLEYQGRADIRLINPGFVKTPLTDLNDFKMPFLMRKV